MEPEDLTVIGHTGDLLVDIYARNLTHIYILPQCSTTAARVLNPAGMDAQFERLRCAISCGILILLRSDLYKDWLLRYNVGTSYPVIKDDDVLNMPIPIIPAAVQTTVIEKVRESIFLHNKSRELFEAAKRAIELAVEQGEDIALTWLNSKVSTAEV